MPHINYVKARCHNALNLMKVNSITDWSDDMRALLRLYRDLIQSKLDYGSIARKFYFKPLIPSITKGFDLL